MITVINLYSELVGTLTDKRRSLPKSVWPVESWVKYDETMEGLPRTNNASEGT